MIIIIIVFTKEVNILACIFMRSFYSSSSFTHIQLHSPLLHIHSLYVSVSHTEEEGWMEEEGIENGRWPDSHIIHASLLKTSQAQPMTKR